MILEKGMHTCDSKPKPLVSPMKMITHKQVIIERNSNMIVKLKKIIEYIQTWLLAPIFLPIHLSIIIWKSIGATAWITSHVTTHGSLIILELY